MRIVIGQPPIPGMNNPQVMQNRQFVSFSNPTHIFPVIPAYGATMLKNAGHEVFWMDGVAERLSWEEYVKTLASIEPDVIAWEVKTPTVKRVWTLIDDLKRNFRSKIILFGDHVTALPKETIDCSQTDVVLLGGDYDFGLQSLVHLLSTLPCRDIPQYWPCTGSKKHDLESLPLIDRELCKWHLYSHNNGNFKYPPGTYTQFGRDCWWRKDGGCTFCSWTKTHRLWNVISPDKAIAEVEDCMSLGVKEIFDDTGTFPPGKWLHEFCDKLEKINKRGRYGKRIRFGCNLRANGFRKDDYLRMGQAGFRFVLFGMESANQYTLDRLNKGERVEDLENALKLAKLARLEPHVTVMVGYPWEGRTQVSHTLDTARRLFGRGLIRTLQATICTPYPNTRLYDELKQRDLVLTEDWNKYDMSAPVVWTPPSVDVNKSVRDLYKSFMGLQGLLRVVMSIRSWADIKYLFRGVKYVFGHLEDFR